MFEPFETFQKISNTFFVFRLVNFLYSRRSLGKNDKFFPRSTAIIIFPHRLDAVFRFYCATQRKKGILVSERNIEDAYTTKVFSSWKKAPQCFAEHQQTYCHKSPASNHVVIPKCKDLGEMTNNNPVNVCEKERKYLFDVIRCLPYIARQGIALQRTGNNDNFVQLMMLLGTKDEMMKS